MSLADKTVHPFAGNFNPECNGMTLLEHYAGLAMQGILGAHALHESRSGESFTYPIGRPPIDSCELARRSVRAAKALIAELEKEPHP